MSGNVVKIPCDNNVDGEEKGSFLKIDGADDYWVSIEGDPSNPFQSVRFCTSGSRDSTITMLIAALFHYGRGNFEQAARCADVFSKDARSKT